MPQHLSSSFQSLSMRNKAVLECSLVTFAGLITFCKYVYPNPMFKKVTASDLLLQVKHIHLK